MTPTTEQTREPHSQALPGSPDEQSAHEQSAQRFRLFVEMLPDPAWMAGPDGVVDFCNRRWCDYTGLPLERTQTPAPASVFHPDDAERCAQLWRRAVEAGEAYETEARIRQAADGHYRWHLCQAFPTRDPSGRLLGWCGICTDVDERKKHAEDMLVLERFLESIVDNMPDAVFVKDAAELRFVRVNKAMQGLAGLTNETCIGRNDYDFFPKEEADFFTRNDRAVLASGRLLEIPEEPMHTPDGTKILHTKKIPILDDRGRPQYLLGITRDITAQKQAEEQLREKNRLLEEAVRSEHEALEAVKSTQARLVQAEKLAALGQLVAGVAHEINNPLAFVSNNVNVLERDLGLLRELLALYKAAEPALANADPAAAAGITAFSDRVDLPYTLANLAELLTRSRDGLRRIQQIVRDLRDFSRHESTEDFQEDANLNAGILSTANIVRGRARTRGVELELDLAQDLPGVTCYPAKVNQVVLNLLTNAIDACAAPVADGAGGVAAPRHGKVTIRTRPAGVGSADAGVEIQVIDSGCGIDPEIVGKIFDPFFTTKPQGKGTGLGLSISHGIVTDHGGRITVESTPGQGACFTVYLPRRGPAASAAERATAESPPGAPAAP